MIVLVLMVLGALAEASAAVAAPMPLLEKDPATSSDFVADLAWHVFGRPYGFKVFAPAVAFRDDKPRCFFEYRVNGGQIEYCEALDVSPSTESNGTVWKTSEKEPFGFVPGTCTFRARFVTEKGMNFASLWRNAQVNKDGTVVNAEQISNSSDVPPRTLVMNRQFSVLSSEKGGPVLSVGGLANFGPLTKPESIFFAVKGGSVPDHTVPAVLPAKKDETGNLQVVGHISTFAWNTDMEVKIGYKESERSSCFSAPYAFRTPKQDDLRYGDPILKRDIVPTIKLRADGVYDGIEVRVPEVVFRDNNLASCELELSEKAAIETRLVETYLVNDRTRTDAIYRAHPELKAGTGYLMRAHVRAPSGNSHYVSDWMTFRVSSDMKVSFQDSEKYSAALQSPDPNLVPPVPQMNPSPAAPPMPVTLGKSISEVVAYQVGVMKAFRTTDLLQPGTKEYVVQAREYLLRAEVLQRIILQHIESEQFRSDLERAHSALCAEMEFLKQKTPALRGGEQLFKIYVAPGLPPIVQPQAPMDSVQ